jgi:hypothetical protein
LQEEFDRVALGKFYATHKRLNKIMSAMNGGTCGVCNDCKETFQGSSGRLQAAMQRRLQVHCFEPSATNYDALTEMHMHFFGSSNRTARGNELLLHNAAMSNYTGTAEMPSNCGELCQVRGALGGLQDSQQCLKCLDPVNLSIATQASYVLRIEWVGCLACVNTAAYFVESQLGALLVLHTLLFHNNTVSALAC